MFIQNRVVLIEAGGSDTIVLIEAGGFYYRKYGIQRVVFL